MSLHEFLLYYKYEPNYPSNVGSRNLTSKEILQVERAYYDNYKREKLPYYLKLCLKEFLSDPEYILAYYGGI